MRVRQVQRVRPSVFVGSVPSSPLLCCCGLLLPPRADAPYLIGQQNLCPTCGSGASAIGNAMLDAVFDFIGFTGMTLLWDLNGLKARNGTGTAAFCVQRMRFLVCVPVHCCVFVLAFELCLVDPHDFVLGVLSCLKGSIGGKGPACASVWAMRYGL
jgi:hypothetical protein